MKLTFEGTAEEIAQIFPGLKTSSLAGATAFGPQESFEVQSAEGQWVSTEFARRALSRRSLKPLQKKVLVALYEAHPAKLSAPQLQKLVSYTPAQFAGLMGAFGRRLARTAGFTKNLNFFDTIWDEERNCWLYGLPESVMEAIRQEKIA
jgi:hypothetical protein